ncbi:MAG: hypothetical protein WCP97_06975 [bacterium]
MKKICLLVCCSLLVVGCGEFSLSGEQQTAVARAKRLFKDQITAGADMSSGRCLSEDLMPGWVVDVVHNPRQEEDDLPENQCQSYLNGTAKHFVELDELGNLVRAK